MKRIKLRFVDMPFAKVDSFGQKPNSSFINYNIRACLERMYELDEKSDNPDYVFTFAPVGKAKGFEYGAYSNAVIIFVQNENVFPDFFCFDYAIGMDSLLRYGDRYLWMPASCSADYTRYHYNEILTKHLSVNKTMANRSFCAMTVSNGTDAALEREHFFHLLSEYKRVDSGGRFLNNVGGRVKDKYEFEAKHKFVIAFDNIENGIVQEKIELAFAAQTIPIYWGNPNVTDIYNEKAFVNCHAFDSFEEVVERIKEIDNDDELYLSMLREPAFIGEAKTLEQWDADLSEFLRKIIEQPKEKAFKRRSENWMGIMQKMRVDGFKRLYYKRQMIRALHTVYSPFEKATSDMRSIQKLKKTIKHGLGLS